MVSNDKMLDSRKCSLIRRCYYDEKQNQLWCLDGTNHQERFKSSSSNALSSEKNNKLKLDLKPQGKRIEEIQERERRGPQGQI